MIEADDKPTPGGPQRVLVVDDEALIRWWLTQALSDRGYVVAEAENGRAALGALADGAPLPDIVLLDYRLPDSEGLGLLSKIVSRVPGGRVILMTAHSTANLEQDAVARGAFAVLPKPFEFQDVVALVDLPARSTV